MQSESNSVVAIACCCTIFQLESWFLQCIVFGIRYFSREWRQVIIKWTNLKWLMWPLLYLQYLSRVICWAPPRVSPTLQPAIRARLPPWRRPTPPAMWPRSARPSPWVACPHPGRTVFLVRQLLRYIVIMSSNSGKSFDVNRFGLSILEKKTTTDVTLQMSWFC